MLLGHTRKRFSLLALSVSVLLLGCSLLFAGERSGKRLKLGQYNADHSTVEMFSAIDKGDISVCLIPKDSTEGRVMIENKTDQPLNVKLPESFAGVPVLAQIGGGMGGGGGGMQGVGGGMGGGMGGGGMGGGFFNVPAEKVGNLKVTTVCLEHGKDEPRPAVKYEIKPIEQFTGNSAVAELCRMLGSGQLNQRAAQVAAWHLNNSMSFQELAAKRIKHANGTSEPYFSPLELHAGMRIAAIATNLAQQRDNSPAESNSLGNLD